MEFLFSNKTKKTRCNLFADYIVHKIGLDTNTMIQVTDSNSFLVVRGVTDSKESVDIPKLIEEFNKEFKDFIISPITHSFDFIRYDVKLSVISDQKFKFYVNDKNPSVNPVFFEPFESDDTKSYSYNGISCDVFEEAQELSTYSDFPHGYSLKRGRSLYNYGKFITHNLVKHSFCEEIEMTLYTDTKDNQFKINCNNEFQNDVLTSYVLDFFNFTYSKLDEKFMNSNIFAETLNPTDDFEFLREGFRSDPIL